jgi:hypothetical protein
MRASISNDGTPYRARHTHSPLKTRPALADGPTRQACRHHARIHHEFRVTHSDFARLIGNDEPANPSVAYKDVATAAQDGRRNTIAVCEIPQALELCLGVGIGKQVSRSADPKRRVTGERLIAPHDHTQATGFSHELKDTLTLPIKFS